MSNYKFVTIVAPQEVRENFSYLRDSLGSSDKQLMQAFWNICTRDVEGIRSEVEALRISALNAKMAAKQIKIDQIAVPIEIQMAAKFKSAPKKKIHLLDV